MLDFLKALPPLVAAILAIYAVDAWRRDFLGRRRIELAEQVLELFYRAKDAISAIRSPGRFDSESKDREREPGESDKQKQLRDLAFVTLQRYQSHSDLFAKLSATRYQVMARFGSDAAKPFDELHREVVVKIIVAARVLQNFSSFTKFDTPPQIEEGIRASEHTIWEGSADPDALAIKMESIITQVETNMRAIILEPNPWVAWFRLRWSQLSRWVQTRLH